MRAWQAEAGAEVELQLAALLGAARAKAWLFMVFAKRRFKRGFAGIDLAAGAVDFPRAEAALFANEQNLIAAQDEEKVRALLRFPGFPVDHPN